MNRWPIRPLGELSETVMGQAPPGKECNFEGRGTPFVKTGEFGDHRPLIREWTTKPLKFARSSDVLVCVVGATSGKLNLGADCAIGRSVAAIRPHPSVLNQGFLYAFLQGWTLRLRSGSQGSAQGVITREMIRSIPVPVPPLEEQERIVKLLDEADQLRKLRAQADRRTANLIPALFHEMFGDPATNVHQWPRAVLGDVIFAAKDGPHVSPKYSSTGVPFLSTRHVKQGKVIWQDLKFLSHEEAALHWKKCKPEKGDVLYTKGGTTGIAAAVTFDTPVAVWVHIALLKTNHAKVDPIWLENMLNSSFCYQQSQELTHGIANRDLGLTRMVKMNMYLPPLPLQKKFAQRVADIRVLEAEQATCRQRLDDLFQSLLHRSFDSKL